MCARGRRLGTWYLWCQRCGGWGTHKAIKLNSECLGESKYGNEVLSRILKNRDPSGKHEIGPPVSMASLEHWRREAQPRSMQAQAVEAEVAPRTEQGAADAYTGTGGGTAKAEPEQDIVAARTARGAVKRSSSDGSDGCSSLPNKSRSRFCRAFSYDRSS